MPLPTVKVGPLMRFWRFTISGLYIFQEKRRGNHVDSLQDHAHEALKGFLKPIEAACIYLPVDQQQHVLAVKELSANTLLRDPSGIHHTTQYFVNSQLSYIARRAALPHWTVETEVNYGMSSNYRADLKVTAIPDEYEEHKPFTIWFESDNADVKTLRRKLGERIAVIGPPDAYMSFVYANSKKVWPRVENAASRLLDEMARHVDAGTCRNSLGVLSIEAPSLYQGAREVTVDAHLMIDGPLVRLAEFHFSWDSCALNEWVTDESGIRYPHRDRRPPEPKYARTFKWCGSRGIN
jgi:hypothetical protein